MDPDDKELVRATLNLAKENNRMLKSLYSSYRWSRILRITYWVIVIGLALTGYYYAQPYLEKVRDIYHEIQQKVETTSNSVKSAL